MHIKFFVEAEESKDATRLVYESLQEIDELILKKEEKSVNFFIKILHKFYN